jgi:hypothetical protein
MTTTAGIDDGYWNDDDYTTRMAMATAKVGQKR